MTSSIICGFFAQNSPTFFSTRFAPLSAPGRCSNHLFTATISLTDPARHGARCMGCAHPSGTAHGIGSYTRSGGLLLVQRSDAALHCGHCGHCGLQ